MAIEKIFVRCECALIRKMNGGSCKIETVAESYFFFLSGVWVASRTETTTEEEKVSVGREAVCCECALITILNGGSCKKSRQS